MMKQKQNNDEKCADLLNKVNNIEKIKNKANEIIKQKKYQEAIEEYTTKVFRD